VDVASYCREVETYLCRKNDGHLIRVVGPSFVVVSNWAERGVPLKIACAGIDRYFERYYRKGPRRRPVKIDFCEADVLDVFDEWRRAVGIADAPNAEGARAVRAVDTDDGRAAETVATPSRGRSLPAHLERVLIRLSSARANGALGDAFDLLIDRVSAELDAARAKASALRGATRQAFLDRLNALDAELLQAVRVTLDDVVRAALAREADEELSAFRATMAPDAFARAREAAIDRLVRERAGLPLIAYR
jgi:hypothetical protein